MATIVNGSDTIAAATADTRDFGDLWGQVVNTVSVAVGERLMPVLTAMLAWVTDNLPAIEATVDAAFAALGEAIDWFTANVVPPLVDAFTRRHDRRASRRSAR